MVRLKLSFFFFMHFCNFPDILYWPSGSDAKVSACSVGNLGSIRGSGRSSGEGSGNPLQYSCLENSTDRGTWWVIVHWVARVQHDLVTKQQQSVYYTQIQPISLVTDWILPSFLIFLIWLNATMLHSFYWQEKHNREILIYCCCFYK